jgi:hypothetical protein
MAGSPAICASACQCSDICGLGVRRRKPWRQPVPSWTVHRAARASAHADGEPDPKAAAAWLPDRSTTGSERPEYVDHGRC